MNYNIILDKVALQEFVEWLPALGVNEKYYVTLFSRKKYAGDGMQASDKAQLKRFISTKERLIDKIRQLEVEVGAYKLKKGPVPQEALAIYINPNPRDLEKATYQGIMHFAKLLQEKSTHINPHSEIMSCIQKSRGQKYYLDFDIDEQDFNFSHLKGKINLECLEVIQTRGGYHLLVNLKKLDPKYAKTFFPDIKKLGVDQTGDQLLPIPGCTQGGFVPKFKAIEDLL